MDFKNLQSMSSFAYSLVIILMISLLYFYGYFLVCNEFIIK